MSVFNRKKKYEVPIGMRRSWWAPIASEPDSGLPVYGDVEEMGAARLGTLTYTTAAADIEGDDQVLDHFEQFLSGTLVAENTLNKLDVNAKIYGHGMSSGVEHSNRNDQAPFGAYAFTEPILKKGSNTPIYRATFLLKIKANPANEAQNAASRQGGSINPSYNSITYTVYACNTDDWRLRQEFATEAEAETWILGLFAATSAYLVSTEIVGSGSVTPAGSNYVTAGENAVLDFGSTDPTKLYDNGSDVTSSIASHKYTISAIAAAHRLVAVFSS